MQRLVLFFGVQLTIIIIAIVAYTGLFDPSSRAARIISSPPANPVNSPEAVKPVQPISPLQIFFKDLLATLSKNWFLFLIPAIVFLTVFFLKEITARRKAQRVDNDNGSSKPDQSQNNDQSTKRQSATSLQSNQSRNSDDYTEISSIPDVRSRSRSFWDTLLDETVAETNRVTGRFARGREERQSGGYRSEKRRNSFS